MRILHYAVVHFYSPKGLLFALISLMFMFMSYNLSSTFQLGKISWHLNFNQRWLHKKRWDKSCALLLSFKCFCHTKQFFSLCFHIFLFSQKFTFSIWMNWLNLFDLLKGMEIIRTFRKISTIRKLCLHFVKRILFQKLELFFSEKNLRLPEKCFPIWV